QMLEYHQPPALLSEADLSEVDRLAHHAEISRARFDQLLLRLNQAMPDPRYQLSKQTLLNQERFYSYEFLVFLGEYARAICGDPDCEWEFSWHAEHVPVAILPSIAGESRATPAHLPGSRDPLPPLPEQMRGRPFGSDEQGRPIKQMRGASILAAVNQLQEYVG